MCTIGFKNIQKLIPTKIVILDKNKIYFPDERRTYLKKFFDDFMDKNNLKLLGYIENLPYYRSLMTRFESVKYDKTKIRKLDNYNFFIRDTQGLFTNQVTLNTNLVIYLFSKKDKNNKGIDVFY